MRPVSLAASLSLTAAIAAAPALARQESAAPPAASAAAPSAQIAERNAAIEARVRDRLARAFAARARIVLQREIVFLGVLKNSRELMKLAIERAPDNPFIWRLAVDLAAAMEDGDPGADAWLSEGLVQLSRLEPDDEVLRVRRILDVISRRQTAEERIAATEALLRPDAVAQIGPRAAARLALDLALLLRRTGDIRGFERTLIQSLDFDPLCPEASEIAAGYFRVNAPTRADEIRAVRLAVLANPSSPQVSLGFASLCLESGAYEAAARVLGVAARLLEARGADENYDAILADYVLALWGSNQPKTALSVARVRQEQLDRQLLAEIDRQGLAITLDERKNVHLPTSTPLATALAAMTSALSPDQAKVAVGNAGVAFDTVLDQLAKRKADKKQVAAVALESAMVQLWLDGSIDKAQAMLSKASDAGPLSDDARARFDGWIALRRKDAALARKTLEPLAERDDYARLGLAVALIDLGEKKEAARLLLGIARSEPGSAFGLWARSRLYAILGATPNILPDSEAISAAAALPEDFVRSMEAGGISLLLRVRPIQSEVRPWDSLQFDIELTNRGDWPLSIGPDGPIKDSATITAAVNIPGEKPEIPQIIILPIDRSYCIEPGQTIRVPIDLSVTDASSALREDALSGAFVSLHAIINWRTTTTGFEPSKLGVESESAVAHVSGERVTKDWVVATLAELRDQSLTPDPEKIVLLASALVRKEIVPQLVPEDARAALDGAGEVLVDCVKRIGPEARAWLVFAAPKGKRIERGKEAKDLVDVAASGTVEIGSAIPALEPFDAVLRDDESAVVRIAWIATRTRRPEDPTLVASLASKDPAVRAYAQDCTQWLIEARDERAKALNLKQ